jgi:hypothetical protein
MYKTERNLVAQFVRRLRKRRSPWGRVRISREFEYQRGRADIIVLADGGQHLIAFEAKLRKWRDALHQAYRNTCFAHSSYVLLPKEVALKIAAEVVNFQQRNVGLCYIDSCSITILRSPRRLKPLEPWLLKEAIAAAEDGVDAKRRSRNRRKEDLPKREFRIRRTRRRGFV